MRILLLETDPGASSAVADAITAHGDQVVRCHAVHASALACAGLISTCPLETTTVDAAVLVRDPARVELTAREQGARCALMRRVPLVVSNPAGESPYGDWAARHVDDDDPDAIISAVDAVVGAPSSTHTLLVEAMVTSTLVALGRGELAIESQVHRRGDRLVITLTAPDAVPEELLGRIADRAHATVRAYDKQASLIDVVIARR